MIAFQTLVAEVKNLKPIPAVAGRLLAVADHPDSAMADIAEVIQYDPVITAGVLRTCNSAYFGMKHPVESIKDAVNLLGIDQVIEVALVRSGSQVLGGSQKGYGMDEGDMWKYSVSSAVLAKQVAGRLGLKGKNTIFTAALVKDMGKIVLEKYVADASEKIADLVENQHFSFQEAEKKALGIDHAELGAMIAKMWKFSPKMVNIIRHHHLSDETKIADEQIAAVYLADCLCMMLGTGVGSDGLSYRFKDQVMKKLGMSAADMSMTIAEFGINMQEVETLLQMA